MKPCSGLTSKSPIAGSGLKLRWTKHMLMWRNLICRFGVERKRKQIPKNSGRKQDEKKENETKTNSLSIVLYQLACTEPRSRLTWTPHHVTPPFSFFYFDLDLTIISLNTNPNYVRTWTDFFFFFEKKKQKT